MSFTYRSSSSITHLFATQTVDCNNASEAVQAPAIIFINQNNPNPSPENSTKSELITVVASIDLY